MALEGRKINKKKVNKIIKTVAGIFAGNYIPVVKKANEARARAMNANQNSSSGGQGSQSRVKRFR